MGEGGARGMELVLVAVVRCGHVRVRQCGSAGSTELQLRQGCIIGSEVGHVSDVDAPKDTFLTPRRTIYHTSNLILHSPRCTISKRPGDDITVHPNCMER